jgi:hypothetical protein
MRNTRKLVASLVAVGALAAGGTAFTASNTIPDKIVGYDTSTISGATATALTFDVSADGATISGADLVFTGDLTGKTVKAGFNTDALVACTVGIYNVGTTSTPVACDGAPYNVPTASQTAFAVSVTS